ncbi:hypothetical protein DASC09_009560 [Saccharomycopsis crataegensis]|uniref:RlpA-like protein double-psi beta-barrel domain-containing protein n=1 Tax=Saccharomycopsis crataegensis TaxID=43959 RepID=A0AAV5QGA0_9ASCO|nr:hypothetical protein DASC09_009560 [Saccharomycopsis crataegensis]
MLAKSLLLLVIPALAEVVYETITETVTPTVYETITVTDGVTPESLTAYKSSSHSSSITTHYTPASSFSTSYLTSSSAKASSVFSSAATSASASASSSGSTHSGDATYYSPSVGIGACGNQNSDSELVCALPHTLYDATRTTNQGESSYCGKSLTVKYGEKSVTVKVVDMCPGCAGDSLDLSPAAFTHLAEESVGRIKVTWSFD